MAGPSNTQPLNPYGQASLAPDPPNHKVPGVIFSLNPNKVRRVNRTVYGSVPVALAGITPEEWKYNPPQEITVEAFLYATGKNHVEDDIKAFERMLRKDPRTGSPPALLFVMGNRHDRVNLHEFTEDPKIWDEYLQVQQTPITLLLHTVELRSL
jgi:hypothetical protein